MSFLYFTSKKGNCFAQFLVFLLSMDFLLRSVSYSCCFLLCVLRNKPLTPVLLMDPNNCSLKQQGLNSPDFLTSQLRPVLTLKVCLSKMFYPYSGKDNPQTLLKISLGHRMEEDVLQLPAHVYLSRTTTLGINGDSSIS